MSAVHVVGQTTETAPASLLPEISSLCGGPLVTSGAEYDLVKRAFAGLTANLTISGAPDSVLRSFSSPPPQTGNETIFIATYSSPVINAFTHPSGEFRGGGLICMPTGMVRFLLDAPEELASIVAHEMGHALDNGCRKVYGSSLPVTRNCESRADTYGFMIITAAGLNSYAFAGAFGRLEMFSGDTSTGILARLKEFSQTHPITPERIANLHKLMTNYCEMNPGRCQ